MASVVAAAAAEDCRLIASVVAAGAAEDCSLIGLQTEIRRC